MGTNRKHVKEANKATPIARRSEGKLVRLGPCLGACRCLRSHRQRINVVRSRPAVIPLRPLARAARGNSSVRRPVVAGSAIGGSGLLELLDLGRRCDLRERWLIGMIEKIKLRGTGGDGSGTARSQSWTSKKWKQAPVRWEQDRRGAASSWLRDREDTEMRGSGTVASPSRTVILGLRASRRPSVRSSTFSFEVPKRKPLDVQGAAQCSIAG